MRVEDRVVEEKEEEERGREDEEEEKKFSGLVRIGQSGGEPHDRTGSIHQ